MDLKECTNQIVVLLNMIDVAEKEGLSVVYILASFSILLLIYGGLHVIGRRVHSLKEVKEEGGSLSPLVIE